MLVETYAWLMSLMKIGIFWPVVILSMKRTELGPTVGEYVISMLLSQSLLRTSSETMRVFFGSSSSPGSFTARMSFAVMSARSQ